MATLPNICRMYLGLCLAAAIPIVGFGQGRNPAEGVGGPLTGPPVLDAPFTADVTTTVRLTLLDSTRLGQSTTARYYRDREGNARVELGMDGLAAPKTVAERHIRTIVAPATSDDVCYGRRANPCRSVFSLNPVSKTARYLSRPWLAYAAGGESSAEGLHVYADDSKMGGNTFAVPIGGVRG